MEHTDRNFVIFFSFMEKMDLWDLQSMQMILGILFLKVSELCGLLSQTDQKENIILITLGIIQGIFVSRNQLSLKRHKKEKKSRMGTVKRIKGI